MTAHDGRHLLSSRGRAGYREHPVHIEQLSRVGEKLGTSVVRRSTTSMTTESVEAAPFTVAASGRCDCSPKGDAPGFVHILDDKTLAIPDRPGIDGFATVRDPLVALLFLIPGVGETLRVSCFDRPGIDAELCG